MYIHILAAVHPTDKYINIVCTVRNVCAGRINTLAPNDLSFAASLAAAKTDTLHA